MASGDGDGDGGAALVPLRRRRDEVIERLAEHFARDHVDVEEFERRVELAHQATTVEALALVTGGLEPLDAARQEAIDLVVAEREREGRLALVERPARRSVVAIFGGAERKGRWRLPARLRVVALFGGVELDLREVVFPPGVTEIRVWCVAGGCEVIVPPTVHLECEGVGILGGFESIDRMPPRLGPDEPVVRITGVALMGGFSIETRLPGESRREARRRRKREQASRRRLER